jgi:uncharacterized membrane protein YebE (DUF533 family)
MEINWTQILTQGIVTFGAVAVAAIPLWRKQRATHDVVEKRVVPLLDETVKSVNGMKAAQIAAEIAAARKGGIIDEKEKQRERDDERRGTSDDRKVP